LTNLKLKFLSFRKRTIICFQGAQIANSLLTMVQ